MHLSKKLWVLGMGGTIAGAAPSAHDHVGYRAGQIAVRQLIAGVPNLPAALGDCALVCEQVAQIDSKDMGWEHWLCLAQRVRYHLSQPEVQAVVVTHGTDTLEETAFFLSRVLPQAALARKPVVLTCAMRPATAAFSDGPQNLSDAIAVALCGVARGVLVVCAGRVHAALHVQKVHPYRLDAFDSGDAGPLAFVEEEGVRWVQALPCTLTEAIAPECDWAALATQVVPRVEIVFSYASATGATVRAWATPALDGSAAVRGIVVAATGNGTIHGDLEVALRELQAQGVRVLRSTRCAYGAVVLANPPNPALLPATPLPPVKARIALMLELMK